MGWLQPHSRLELETLIMTAAWQISSQHVCTSHMEMSDNTAVETAQGGLVCA
jgi:hypothetical protein